MLIEVAKERKEIKRWNRQQKMFTRNAIALREMFGWRYRQKQRMYLYLERIGKA